MTLVISSVHPEQNSLDVNGYTVKWKVNCISNNNKLGVLITGNPGSGKSAFLTNLLCSNTSSPIIHNRILGCHFCMHFNKWTRSGANFVGNLANMIALRVAEYRQVILTDPTVRGVLNKDCSQDPEWCFEQAILRPLKNSHSSLSNHGILLLMRWMSARMLKQRF